MKICIGCKYYDDKWAESTGSAWCDKKNDFIPKFVLRCKEFKDMDEKDEK